MIQMTDERKKLIESAASNLLAAQETNKAYALNGFMSADTPKTLAVLKHAKNVFWRECHALLVETGPRSGRKFWDKRPR